MVGSAGKAGAVELVRAVAVDAATAGGSVCAGRVSGGLGGATALADLAGSNAAAGPRLLSLAWVSDAMLVASRDVVASFAAVEGAGDCVSAGFAPVVTGVPSGTAGEGAALFVSANGGACGAWPVSEPLAAGAV